MQAANALDMKISCAGQIYLFLHSCVLATSLVDCFIFIFLSENARSADTKTYMG